MEYIKEIGFEEELYKLPPMVPNPLDEPDIQHLWDPLGPSIEDSRMSLFIRMRRFNSHIKNRLNSPHPETQGVAH